MVVSIAIPEATSRDSEYNRRALPTYVDALKAAGAEAVIVPLAESPEAIARLLDGAQGILLPGCRFDVDPRRYGEDRAPECGEDDPVRSKVDELLLRRAFAHRLPVLAICHGAQTLNVWRGGALVQDLKTAVNHRPGRDVVEAHSVRIAPETRLFALLGEGSSAEIQVNSSHHQAIRRLGTGLKLAAVSPADGVIEAVELDDANHFVVAVQWHPERSYAQSEFSRAIFASFIQAAWDWKRSQPEKKERD
jgi:putative glutamine amidotransferase